MKILRLFSLFAVTLFLAASANAAPTASSPVSAPASSANHVVTPNEIQGRIDQTVQSEAADRQAIRDLLARPDVRRVAGSAGLNLQRADAAVGTLSGPELSRVASQAREANSQLAGGATVTMTWTMVIIVVVALVILIALL